MYRAIVFVFLITGLYSCTTESSNFVNRELIGDWKIPDVDGYSLLIIHEDSMFQPGYGEMNGVAISWPYKSISFRTEDGKKRLFDYSVNNDTLIIRYEDSTDSSLYLRIEDRGFAYSIIQSVHVEMDLPHVSSCDISRFGSSTRKDLFYGNNFLKDSMINFSGSPIHVDSLVDQLCVFKNSGEYENFKQGQERISLFMDKTLPFKYFHALRNTLWANEIIAYNIIVSCESDLPYSKHHVTGITKRNLFPIDDTIVSRTCLNPDTMSIITDKFADFKNATKYDSIQVDLGDSISFNGTPLGLSELSNHVKSTALNNPEYNFLLLINQKSSFGKYVKVYYEIENAIDQIRDSISVASYDKPFYELTKDQERELTKRYPQAIREKIME